jgi:hypothetical protein
MKQWTRILGLPTLVLVIGGSLLCVFAPWQQVHPSETSLVHSLGRAALWTHVYDSLPGARLDGFELLVEISLLIASSVLLGVLCKHVTAPSA